MFERDENWFNESKVLYILPQSCQRVVNSGKFQKNWQVNLISQLSSIAPLSLRKIWNNLELNFYSRAVQTPESKIKERKQEKRIGIELMNITNSDISRQESWF